MTSLVPAVSKLSGNLTLWPEFRNTLIQNFKSIIYNGFIRSTFKYCPLEWHFCGKTNYNKLEKIWERSLRILQDTYEQSYEEILNRNGSTGMILGLHSANEKRRYKVTPSLIGWAQTYNHPWSSTLLIHKLKLLLLETYKSFHGIIANKTFSNSTVRRRSVKLIQPKRRTTSNGLQSFWYLRSKLWNDIINSDAGMANCDFDNWMGFLKH